MSEPWDPIPPRHGEDEAWPDAPTIVCPECGGRLRRDLGETPGPWRCDLHGEVEAVVEWPDEDE